jgi:hypothetical protein
MARNGGFGAFCFRFVQTCSRPATKHVYQSFPDVSPSQTHCFGRTQASAGYQQHQHLVQGLTAVAATTVLHADINQMSRHAVFSNLRLIHSGEPDSLTGTTSLSLKSRVLTGDRNSRLFRQIPYAEKASFSAAPLLFLQRSWADQPLSDASVLSLVAAPSCAYSFEQASSASVFSIAMVLA